jgi:chromosome segregation ATPase
MSPSQILNQMLRDLADRINASDAKLVELRAEVERCNHGCAVAQERLDAALSKKSNAEREYRSWLNYLNTLADRGSTLMKEKLTDLGAVTETARLEADDLRDNIRQWTKRSETAKGIVAIAEQQHKELQAEHARIAEEVAKA